jgi:hypothetical protein
MGSGADVSRQPPRPRRSMEMDGSRFDSLIRSLVAPQPRRAVTRAIGGLTLAGVAAVGLAPADGEAGKKKKKCKKCGSCRTCKKGKCKPKPNGTDCGGGQACQSGACRCPEGQDACGGACLESCPSIRLRNPVTCACCRPTGEIERECAPAENDPCCSGLFCEAIGDEGTACPGRTLGQPCDFDDQCESGNCNVNLVCA